MYTIRDCLTEPLINASPSSIDQEYLEKMRIFIKDNIYNFADSIISEHSNTDTLKIVDIGITDNINEITHQNIIFHTIDIDAQNNPTFVCDITKNNQKIISDNEYDICILSEVLEHTSNPFDAFAEVYRFTKHNGYIIMTSPLNFRIHGPLYDTTRLTEWFYKNTAKQFNCDIIKMLSLEDKSRTMFPISYFCVFKKLM